MPPNDINDTLLKAECADGLECPAAARILQLNKTIYGNGDYSKSVLGRLQKIETYLQVTWALIVLVLPIATALAVKFIK